MASPSGAPGPPEQIPGELPSVTTYTGGFTSPGTAIDWGLLLSYLSNPPQPGVVNSVSTYDEPKLNGAVKAGDRLPLVFGKRVVEGRVAWRKNDFGLWYVLVLVCAGPIEAIDEVRLNGTPVNSVGSVTYTKHLGGYSQSVDSIVGAHIGSFRLPGTAYVMFTFDGLDISTINQFSFLVRGLNNIYDPRGGGSTAYTTNPALCLRHLLVDTVQGGRVATSLLNDTSWGTAADDCDTLVAGEKRYQLNLAITQPGDVTTYLEAIRGCFAAEVFQEDGLLCCRVDKAIATGAVLAFDTSTNCWDVEVSEVPLRDRPTRIIVRYQDAADAYKDSSAQSEDPGIATGAVLAREATYGYDGLTDAKVANRVATYHRKRAAYPYRFNFKCNAIGERLSRWQKNSLTTSGGLAAQLILIEDFEVHADGTFTVTARQYDAGVYSEDSVTPDTPLSTSLPGAFTTPDDVTYVSKADYDVPNTATTTALNIAWNTYQAITYQLPVGNPYLLQLRVRGYTGAGYTTKVWADLAATEQVIPLTGNLPPASATDFKLALFSVLYGSHANVYFPSGQLAGYSGAWGGPTGGARFIIRVESTGGVLSTGINVDTPASAVSGSGVDVGPVEAAPSGSGAGQAGEFRAKELAANGTSYAGFRAPDSLAGNRVFVLPSADGAADDTLVTDGAYALAFAPRVKLQASTPGSAQTGHSNISGTAKAGIVQAVAAAAGDTPLDVQSASSPTAALAKFTSNGTLESQIDKVGSFVTKQVDRTAPYVEPQVEATSDTTINSTTPADITGLVVGAFTMPSACRLLVSVTAWVECTTLSGTSAFELILNVDGSNYSVRARWLPGAAGEHNQVTRFWVVDVAAGASVTIKGRGAITTGSSSYTVKYQHTSISWIATGKF